MRKNLQRLFSDYYQCYELRLGDTVVILVRNDVNNNGQSDQNSYEPRNPEFIKLCVMRIVLTESRTNSMLLVSVAHVTCVYWSVSS
jgi:hypothetical protein